MPPRRTIQPPRRRRTSRRSKIAKNGPAAAKIGDDQGRDPRGMPAIG